MEQFFILGRNPELSRAEVFAYLEARNANYRQVLFSNNYLIVDTDFIDWDIQNFGGLLMLGKINFKGTLTDFNKFVDKGDVIPSDKFTYSIYGNMGEEQLIDKFKKERRKAVIRHGKPLNLQTGDIAEVKSADYNVFMLQTTQVFFGLADQVYSHKGVEKRDMKKPVRRESLAISPRLAKILINLSGAKQGDLLLDPFCGVGGILQEALVRGIRVMGIDKDNDAILAAKQNLRWLEKNYKITSYELLSMDSKSAPDKQFGAVACEPALGALVKREPGDKEANQFIQSFESQIIQILRRVKNIKKKEARIAITFPFIRDFAVNAKRVCFETGLQVYSLDGVNFPIREFRPGQFIGREIYVLK